MYRRWGARKSRALARPRPPRLRTRSGRSAGEPAVRIFSNALMGGRVDRGSPLAAQHEPVLDLSVRECRSRTRAGTATAGPSIRSSRDRNAGLVRGEHAHLQPAVARAGCRANRDSFRSVPRRSRTCRLDVGQFDRGRVCPGRVVGAAGVDARATSAQFRRFSLTPATGDDGDVPCGQRGRSGCRPRTPAAGRRSPTT